MIKKAFKQNKFVNLHDVLQFKLSIKWSCYKAIFVIKRRKTQQQASKTNLNKYKKKDREGKDNW
jgi:hypothetical protein